VRLARPTGKLSPMDPAIRVIPTFGIYLTYNPAQGA
jgi:hypothetical protein